MPNWNQVLEEINGYPNVNPLDAIRRKYLKLLHEKTGRNIIAYYSGFLQKPKDANTIINDDDKNGLMAAIHQLDRTKGLDLLLHTPGGESAATESIVDYLRRMFDINIRAIIPQIAMSAGTMIACSCNKIIMGKQSNIGPIDPQFGGIPAHGVIAEFEEAIKKIKEDPSKIPLYQVIVGKYHPTFIGECQNAIDLSSDMVKKWLTTGMFKNKATAEALAQTIVNYLNNHEDTKTHARHIHIDEAKSIGLEILDMEEDQEMQDNILTIHHAYMHAFANSTATKIIENHNGNAVVFHSPQIFTR